MTGTIRLKFQNPEDKAGEESQTVIGEMGYQWHFAPNETKVLTDDYGNRTLAANATGALGTDIQQTVAPNVVLDDDDNSALV